MKKLFIAALCVLVLIPMLSGCFGLGGSGDWVYPLPNDYVILRNNAVSIIFGKQDDAYSISTIVQRHIAGFSFNNRFVGIQRLPIDGGMDYDYHEAMTLIEKHDIEDFEYYLVDTEEDTILGPLDAAGFNTACEQYGVDDLCDWIDTASVRGDSLTQIDDLLQ